MIVVLVITNGYGNTKEPCATLQVMPKPNPKDETKVDVDVMVKERPMKTADVDLSWGLAPNANGIPLPADKFPGGSLTFENRNLGGQGNQFSASITSENFLQPHDDVGFKVTTTAPVRGTVIKLIVVSMNIKCTICMRFSYKQQGAVLYAFSR